MTFFLRFWPYILALLLAIGVWWKADHWCNAACRDQRDEAVEARAQLEEITDRLKAAQERATHLALEWSKAIQRVEVRYVESQQRRHVTFANVRERTGRIRVDLDAVRIRVPAGAVSVLADAGAAANGGAPEAAGRGGGQAPAVPDPAGGEGADTTLTEWVEFATKAAEAYADANAKRQAAVDAALACHAYVGKITEETP
jgi:hypothetical protein